MKNHLILVAAVLVIVNSSPAADLFWSGDDLTEGGAGTWDTTAARFGTSSGGPFSTVWANANSDNVTFEATAGTVLVSPITLNGTLNDNSGYTFATNTAIASSVLTLGSSSAINVANGVTTTMTSTLGGTGGILTKNGPGTLLLNNNNNTYTGGTIFNAGTIQFAAANTTFNNLGTPTSKLTINADGVTLLCGVTKTVQQPVDQKGDLNVHLTSTVNMQFSLAGGPWTLFGSKKITVTEDSTGVFILGGSTSTLLQESGGSFSLTKEGAGLMTMQTENSMTGGFRINAGSVRLNATTITAPFGTSTSTLTLNGGTLTTSATRAVGTPVFNPITVTANSFITTSSTAATIDLNLSGALSATPGTILTINSVAASGNFFPRFSGGFTYAGKIVINNNNGSGTATTTLNLFNTSGNDQTFSDVISGTGSIKRSATTAGTGGITYMTAANTYSGGTTLNDGSIGLAIDSTPGPNSGGPPLNDGPIGTGTLAVAPAAGGLPMLFTYGGDRQVGNAINLANTTAPLIVSNADTLTLYGLITGTGSITKQGAGQLRLSPHGGNNSYSGGTTVIAGEISCDTSSSGPADAPTAGPAGTGTITMGNGAAISALSNPHTVGNHLVFSGISATLTGGRDLMLSGNADLGGNTVTLTVDNSALTTLSGQLSNGGLIKDGPSTLILSGVNIYGGGTTVSTGTLEVQKDGGLGSGNVAVASGATLRLTAGTANTYINSAATLTLNGASPLVKLDFTGTPNSISALRFGAVQQANGTWGAIGSGANHESALFTGTGMLIVGGVVYGQINRILSIVDNGGGTFTLTLQGSLWAEYSLVSSADVTAPLNTWSTVTGSTQIAPAPSGIWTFPVSAAGPQYYRLKATNPAP